MTGCAKSSRSGARSAGWTARPMTRCGSVTRRRGRPSTGAAARISPSSTASGPAPGRPRRHCANGPRSCAGSTDWGPTARGVPRPAGRVEGGGPRGQGRRRRAVAAVQGRPGHVLLSPQRRLAPSVTPSSAPTPTPRRRCWRRPRGSTPRDLGRRARRAAHHRRQVGHDRQGAPRARRRPGAAAARGREEGAGRAVRTASIRRPRPAPTNSASAQSNSSGRRRRPRRPGAPRTPRRRGPTPSSGGSGPRRRPRRSARSASSSLPARCRCRRSRGVVAEAVQQALGLAFGDGPAAFLLRGELQRGARPHRPRPVERQHDHRDPREDQPDAGPRVRVRGRSAATTPPAGPRRTPRWIRPARSTPAPTAWSAAPASRSRR